VVSKNYQRATICIVNFQKSILPNIYDSCCFWINFFVYLQFRNLISNNFCSQVTFSYNTNCVSCGPDTSPMVCLCDCPVTEINYLITILQVTDKRTFTSNSTHNLWDFIANISLNYCLLLCCFTVNCNGLLNRAVGQNLYDYSFLISES